MTTEPAPQEYALPALPEPYWPGFRPSLDSRVDLFTADQMHSYARAALAARDDAQGDQVADVAIALEQQRALKIVADVAALRSGRDMTEAFDAGFVTACDEIDLRLRTERWALGGVDGPLPAARDDARDATGRSAKDYAIEHAEYLAGAAERFLAASDALYEAQATADDTDDDEIEDAQQKIEECQETMTDARSTLSQRIYEFRKRRDRAIDSARGKG